MSTRRSRRLVVAAASAALVATAFAGTDTASARPVSTGAAQSTAGSACTRAYGSVEKLPAVRYGDRLMDALTAGKVFAAGCYGAGPVVRMLDAEGVGPGTQWKRVSTDATLGFLYSTYDDGEGQTVTLAILLGDREPGGWHAVTGARAVGTAGRLASYPDKLIAAWEHGEKDLMAQLAAPPAFKALWTHPGAVGNWTRTSIEVASNGTYAAYHQGAHDLTLRIAAADALAGRPQAVKTALFI